MLNLSVQAVLEEAIALLIDEFAQNPYIFFTEADAVARFHQILMAAPELNRPVKTRDGYHISLVHREYPTFFRFDDHNPTKRLGAPAKRGHYDTVVLNPEFVAAHPIAAVHNRSIKAERDESITPLMAAIEFKLDPIGWSAGRSRGTIAEFGKLLLSDEAPLRYFVSLIRYTAPKLTRWTKYWPAVRNAAGAHSGIRSIFAVHWLTVQEGVELFSFGEWQQKL